LPVLMRFFP